MQTKESKKINRVFVAFPGMGKTTYAQQHANVVDLDFGNFRSAMGMKPHDKNVATILIPFQKLVQYYYQDGFDVLTNEPAMIPLIVQGVPTNRVMVVIPKDEVAHVERVWNRARGDNRHSQSFAYELERHYGEWISNWIRMAKQYHVPIKEVDYFEEALR